MKLNILHLSPDFNYSDGRSYYVYLLLKYLKRRGHNVFLATNGGDSFDRIEKSGIKSFVFPRLLNKQIFLNSVKIISGLVSENNINIIHSHHRYFELISNSVKNKKVHKIFTALSIVGKRYFVEYKSERIIAVSNAVREMLINRFHVDKKKIFLIPNFADSEELNPVEKGNTIEKKNYTVFSAGRFDREKNYETLLNAVSMLKDFKIKVTLIGEGKDKVKYEKIIKEKNLNAELLPPQKNLRTFFEQADVCVLSSIRDPMPTFMLQSGLFEKPFIGPDTDGIPEVIRDNVNGLLFKAGNVNELAAKIKFFLQNKDKASECASNLNKLVRENYTEKKIVPEIEKLYESLF